MRHRKTTPKLGYKRDERARLLRNMVTSLVIHERITTSEAKARAARRIAEKVVTKGRTDTVAARRQVAAMVFGAEAVRKIFTELSPRYRERPGGYTRILKLGPRFGDASEACIVEFVDSPIAFKPEEKEKKEKKGKKAKDKDKEKQDKKMRKNEAGGPAPAAGRR
jgi:large subunit ribosomal protein L17